MKTIDLVQLFSIFKQTQKIFTLIDSWRFLKLEFPHRVPFTEEDLIAEKLFQVNSESNWLGCFNISSYMHKIKSYDYYTIGDMRFIYSSDDPLLLFNLLDDYYSNEGLIFSEFQMQTYQTILSIDESKYDWIAMYDDNEHDKPIVFFDGDNSNANSILMNRINNIC